MAIFHFNPTVARIRLRVEIVGDRRRTLDMLLDTGATRTTIPLWAAEEIGIPPHASERRVETTTASDTIEAPIVTVPSVHAFGHTVENIEVLCLDLPPSLCIDGLLGLNFLSRFKLFVHFPKGVLIIQRPSKNPFANSIQVWELLKAAL